MLKKFLTTIIVLAATATAWADGYSYTLDKDNTRATISADADSENTIDDVITAIKGLSPKVQYVILPDGMTKEQVNAIGASFDATVSKNEATQTETKWVYTWNEKEVVFEGTPTTIDGKPTATVKVLVPLTEKNSSYQLYGSPYEGTVFFDSNGKCYGVNNESDIFNLKPSYKGYTYNNGTTDNNGTTEYIDEVAESEGKYYGVINNPTKVALELNKPVSWTYENDKYAHLGEVYNNGTNIFYQGGTEYRLTTETRYTYDNGSKLYPENGLTRTADNKTYGWVGGTQVSLTQKDVLYDTYGKLYTGAIRKEGETTYGNTDKPYNLSQESVYTYTDNGTKKWYKGAIRDVEENGETIYYGNSSYGSNIEEYPLTEKKGNTYTLNNVTKEYSGLVRTDSEGKPWGNTGEQFPITKQEGKYTYNNGTKTIYEGTVYKKVADNTYWGIWSGTEIELEEKKNAYTYKLNSWPNDKAVYTGGATRTDANGIIYGNTGEMFPLTTTTAPWTYDNGKYIYEGEYFSGTNGNVGGTFYELQTITATAEKPVYTYYSSNIQYYYDGEVTGEGNEWYMQYYGTVDGSKIQLTPSTSGEYKYYTKDGKNIIYTGTVYTKFDGTVEYEYACEGAVAITKAEGDVKYYTDTDTNKKVVYTGNVYTDNDKEYGVKDASKDVELTKEDVIVRSDNNSIYTAEKYYNVGTESLVGIENPHLVALEYGTIYIKADNSIYTGEYYCDDKENYYGYDGTEVPLTNGKYYLKDNGDVYSDKVFYYLKEDKSKSFVGYSYISDVVITEGEEYLYTKEEQQLLYTGKVYHKQGDENIYIGFENQYNEITLTPGKAWFYTSDGKETQYTAGIYNDGENTVGFIGGVEKELTQGEVKYYTKGEQTIIATDNTRISLDGDTYCDGSNAIGLTNKEGFTANLYKDGDRYVIYTGKVYGDATGYIGGTETELDYGDIYKKEDGTIYTGYRNENNTKGCNNAKLLTTLFTYEYENPNTKETATLESENHLTTYEVDYTVTVEQKEIEVPTGKIHLIAYVSIPGSLYYAIGDKWYGADDLTAVTLSGSLNYADIGNGGKPLAMNKYGHAIYDTYSYDPETNQTTMSTITPSDDIQEGAVENKNCAFTNVTSLQYIDFSDAKFNVNTDMQIARGMTYNVENVKTVYLPKDDSFTIIPAGCLINAKGITEICIPKNIKIIEGKAFHNTALSHIYTTSDNEDVIVDNGPKTITLPAGLEEIRSAGNGTESTFTGSGMDIITDVYVLSEKAPKCAPYSFQGSMTYGNNGFAGDLAHPIGRHNYKNGDKWFVVLHYPSELAGTEEEKNYTDVTRVYTLADETGAVDGRGHSMKWPKHVEFGQAYKTALAGKLWDGTTTYDTNYQGWHEIVLTGNSLARDFDPQTENTEFVYRDWLTICVPYDMKKSQMLSLLGVDPTKNANGAEGVIYEYVCARDANGNPVKDAEGNYTFEYKEIQRTNAPLYPDVRALTHVSRSVDSRKMTLHFTKLIEQNEIAALSEGDNNETTVTTHDVAINESHGQGFTKTEQTEDDPVVMKGGHPYLIRAYVPKEWNDQIKNLGMYIMAAASSANHAATEQGIGESELPYQYGDCTVQASGVEMYLPCLKHKVHAFDADSNTEINSVVAKDKHESFSYIDTDKDAPILYHFIGTYTETKIPQYAYYIGKTKEGVHKFSRTTKTGANAFTWAPYTAVIIGLSAPNYDAEAFDDKATGTAGSIDNIVVQPGVTGDDLKIYVGEDEKLGASGARLSLGGFDDSTVTGIVDVNVNSNVNISNNKVYSINGQYMGTSLNNLPKGIYIINGQKKVVK